MRLTYERIICLLVLALAIFFSLTLFLLTKVHSTEEGSGPFTRGRGTRHEDALQVKTGEQGKSLGQSSAGSAGVRSVGGGERKASVSSQDDEIVAQGVRKHQQEEKKQLHPQNTGRKRYSKYAVTKNDDIFRSLPIIYIVTPTYERATQIADLTRVAYSLILGGNNLHWIIVEDTSTGPTLQVKQFISSIQQLTSSCCQCRQSAPQFLYQQSNVCCYTSSLTNISVHSRDDSESSNIKSSCCCSCTCSNLAITHLTASTPVEYKIKSSKPNWLKPRGVAQRNAAILWLKEHHAAIHLPSSHFTSSYTPYVSNSLFSQTKQLMEKKHEDQVKNVVNDQEDRGTSSRDKMVHQVFYEKTVRHLSEKFDKSHPERVVDSDTSPVIYFADDDNTYDVRLFDEMRYTDTVTIWPVGIVGGLKVEKPIVSNVTGKVTAFTTVWKPHRPFPIDMAGFAINLPLLLSRSPLPLFSYESERGYQESHILSQVISSWSQLQPRADNCSKVYVWHTRTEKVNLNGEAKLSQPSDTGIVYPIAQEKKDEKRR